MPDSSKKNMWIWCLDKFRFQVSEKYLFSISTPNAVFATYLRFKNIFFLNIEFKFMITSVFYLATLDTVDFRQETELDPSTALGEVSPH